MASNFQVGIQGERKRPRWKCVMSIAFFCEEKEKNVFVWENKVRYLLWMVQKTLLINLVKTFILFEPKFPPSSYLDLRSEFWVPSTPRFFFRFGDHWPRSNRLSHSLSAAYLKSEKKEKYISLTLRWLKLNVSLGRWDTIVIKKRAIIHEPRAHSGGCFE